MFVSGRGAARSLALGWFVLSGCGARTSLHAGSGDAGLDADLNPAVTCSIDADCGADPCAPMECREGVCVDLPHVVCEDHDDCTDDSCDSATGQCVHRALSLDLDGDGHKSPRPGYAPGAPGSCGDDCDDTSAAAHPGGQEVCDGADNDCDGVIDNGATYQTPDVVTRISSTALDRASSAGLAFDGTAYGASYTGIKGPKPSPYFQGLSAQGGVIVPETSTTSINADTYAGGLLFNGQYFGTSWQDARQDGEYEIYFNRLNSKGERLGPDLRVTSAPGKSLNPVLGWNGSEFLDVWDDRRFDDGSSNGVRLFGQRISLDGQLIGGNVQLTGPGVSAEYPSIAVGRTKLGIVFSSVVGDDVHASFITTDADFSNPSAPIDVGSTRVSSPHVVYAGGNFVVIWAQQYGAGWGKQIYGAVVDESGALRVPEQPVTASSSTARDPAILSLGDRVMLVWSAKLSGPLQLFRTVLRTDLTASLPGEPIGTSSANSYDSILSFGPNGAVGLLFDSELTGVRQTYFSRMACMIPLR